MIARAQNALNRGILAVGIVILCVVLRSTPAGGGGRFTIDTKEDWEQWSFPKGGVVQITDDGWVRLGHVRRNINACLDAHTFTYDDLGRNRTGGIRAAGSNPSDAEKIIDGDPSTFWAPDPTDDVEDWWIEVDLGRVVTATKLKLVFAEGRTPFPEFKIYLSQGIEKYPGSRLKALEYTLLAKTQKPNTEYVFEYPFDLEKDRHDHPLLGRYLQYIRIFFPQKVADPGLAELEVTSLGENIALKTLDRGGWIDTGDWTSPEFIFDGLLRTPWVMIRLGDDWFRSSHGQPWMKWDLGCQFWMDTIRITSDAPSVRWGSIIRDTYFEGFKLYVSDGTEATATALDVWKVDGKDISWEQVADINNKLTPPPLLNFDFTFSPPKPVRYVFLHHFYGTGRHGTRGAYVYEFQIFGEGFIRGTTLTSDMIDLGKEKNLAAISWKADTPPGARVEIRTRTGEQVREETRYYDSGGTEITKEKYDRLPSYRQGPIITKKVPVEGYWSAWSPVYDRPGAQFASPSPRRYLLIEAKLLSDDPTSAPSLDSITLFHTEPAAKVLFGEIAPPSAEPGLPERFHFFIRPTYASGNTGFNRVLIKTPSTPDSVRVKLGGIEVTPERVEVTEDSLLVYLPEMIRRKEVEVLFRCTLLRNSTVFEAFVSGIPGSWQRVDPDPSRKRATTVMLPSLVEDRGVIRNLNIRPRVVTPNGDGINDRLDVTFTVLYIEGSRKAHVSLHTLRGDPIKELYSGFVTTGSYRIHWDGTDGSGERVPPGSYLCEISVDSDAGKEVVNRVITVAY